MRIITNGTRDYYDTAGWQDEEGRFFRLPYAQARSDAPFRVPFLWPYPIDDHEHGQAEYRALTFGVCAVAGEAYPYARLARKRVGARGTRDARTVSASFLYEAAEAEDAAKALRGQRRGYVGLFSDRCATVGAFMAMPRDLLSGWALDAGAVTAVLAPAPPESWQAPYDRACAAINCDGLGERELYKALDPASAFLRIEAWVSGVLGSNPEILEVSDATRAAKAGFDGWSFRTRPGTRKPRRKGGAA